MDRAWWKQSMVEVQTAFTGERISHSKFPGTAHAVSACFKNSGANAIAYAAHREAARIVLLGYDLQHTGGRKHWHGDHPKPLNNAGSVKDWPLKFQKLALAVPRDVEIINCSRHTALTCFRRGELEQALA